VLAHLDERLLELDHAAAQSELGEERPVGAVEGTVQQGPLEHRATDLPKKSTQLCEWSTRAANRSDGRSAAARPSGLRYCPIRTPRPSM